MSLSLRYLVAEDDKTVTRVARSQYHRWFSEGETLPANRVGRELRLLEAAVGMDHHCVVDVLRILPGTGCETTGSSTRAQRCGWR